MKNIFKLMGVALIASTMLFVACGKEGEEENTGDDNTTGGNDTPTYTLSVAATLGTATLDVNEYDYMGAAGDTNVGMIAKRFEGENFYFPGFYFYVAGLSKETATCTNIDLYVETYYTVGSYSYGDWQYNDGMNTEVTVLDPTTMRFSTNIACSMFSLTDYRNFYQEHDEDEDPVMGTDVEVRNFSTSIANVYLKK